MIIETPAAGFIHDLLPDQPLTREVIDGKRFYVTPTGEKYPSVTSVLSELNKDGIKQWVKRVGEEAAEKIKTQAANRGTKVHKILEDFVSNKPNYLQDVMPTSKMMFKQLQPYLIERCNNIRGIELSLYSDNLKAAGQCDLVCEYNGELAIVDYKTSSKPKKEEWIRNYFLQSTAYAIMVEERYKITVPKIVIMIAVEDDHPQIYEKSSHDFRNEVEVIFKSYSC